MRRLEDGIQRGIVNLLMMAATPGVLWFAVPNGGERSKAEAAIMKGLGVRAGMHDLFFVLPPDGRAAGLELKRPGGARSLAQVTAARGLEIAGGLSATADNLDDAIAILIAWGALDHSRFTMQRGVAIATA